jgi:transcription initiation factor TFIIB
MCGLVVNNRTSIELARVGRKLHVVADERCIAPGTPRATASGAAVYAADRLTPGRALAQSQVTETTDEIVATTKSKIARYSRRLHDAGAEQDVTTGDVMAAAGDD